MLTIQKMNMKMMIQNIKNLKKMLLVIMMMNLMKIDMKIMMKIIVKVQQKRIKNQHKFHLIIYKNMKHIIIL